MDARAMNLPDGFQLDQAVPGLPDGFVLDQQPISADNVVRSLVRGMPFIGGAADKVQAFGNALIGPLTGLNSQAGSLGERYSQNLTQEQARDQAYDTQHPIASTIGQLTGGVASTVPFAATATGAKLLGLSGSVPGMAMRGAASGAAIGGADALTRGEDPSVGAGVGAVLGGAAGPAGRLIGKVATGAKNLVSSGEAPTTAATKTAAERGYQAARESGLEVKPSAIQGLSQKIQAGLNELGIDENLAPKTFSILGKIDQAPGDSTVTARNLMSLRRTLGNAAGSIDKTERMAAKTAQNNLDEFIANMPAGSAIKGDAGEVSALLKEANANYAAAARSSAVDKKVVRAELRAAAANSGQNVANTIRQRIADILLNPAELRGYSAPEIAQMQKIVKGTILGNVARVGGNMLGGGGGMGTFLTAGAGGLAAGPAGVALPAAGYALKKLQNLSTTAQIRKLDELIRSRSPLAEKMPKRPKTIPGTLFDLLPSASALTIRSAIPLYSTSR